MQSITELRSTRIAKRAGTQRGVSALVNAIWGNVYSIVISKKIYKCFVSVQLSQHLLAVNDVDAVR